MPRAKLFTRGEWQASFERIIELIIFCDGRARRAKADSNGDLLSETYGLIQTRVLDPLRFDLSNRVNWPNSYAIPEDLLPFVYRNIVSLLVDCFPLELTTFLDDVIERSFGQLGVYTEGFRQILFAVIEEVMRAEASDAITERLFALLCRLREHLMNGVDNRHELVPELLRLLPLFARLGASEEAQRIYTSVLGVSMGPTWYKEDQFGLVTGVLEHMSYIKGIGEELQYAAAYLERASGEMTFQRFIRYDKAALLGVLFRMNMSAAGVQYFRRQSWGSVAELWDDLSSEPIDRVSPTNGMRFAGGRLDEQACILQIVQASVSVDWRIRWSLLEIFICGDDRHVDSYGTEFAKVVNGLPVGAVRAETLDRRIEALLKFELPPEESRRFVKGFLGEIDELRKAEFKVLLAEVASSEAPHVREQAINPEEPGESKKARAKDDDAMYFPGLFGRRSSLEEADVELSQARAQLKIGNLSGARSKAVAALSRLQAGDWDIWGGNTGNGKEAKEIIETCGRSASDVVEALAPLVKEELYAPKWRTADSLINRMSKLLSGDEKRTILQHVIEHVHLMVGDADRELKMFAFLREEVLCSDADANRVLFNFVLSLTDHPHRLRRERSAVLLEWLIRNNREMWRNVAAIAFSNGEGFGPDILCGILDMLSIEQPLKVWEEIADVVCSVDVPGQCDHFCRIAAMARIASRAGSLGIASAEEVERKVVSQFRSGRIELDSDMVLEDLPKWASCIEEEWTSITRQGSASNELLHSVAEVINAQAPPFSLVQLQDLENALSRTFRSPETEVLNRWEGRVRYALNRSLLPWVTEKNWRALEEALRIYNPLKPELSLISRAPALSEKVVDAVASRKDYTNAISQDEYWVLDYQELVQRGYDGRSFKMEVTALVVPSSLVNRSFFVPPFRTRFPSNAVPNPEISADSHECCCRVDSKAAFFGTFTPAVPLTKFVNMCGATNEDFKRENWRSGRANDVRFNGLPFYEGCMLLLKKEALRLPQGRKLAWIIRIDGALAAMVDSENRKLA